MKSTTHILILAAGQGKRMQSALPKVLHPVLFQPLLHHVVELAFQLPHQSVSVVVGHGEEQVRDACKDFPKLKYFKQEKQLGTADAVKAAEKFLVKEKGHVLILSGDVVLLRVTSMQKFLEGHFRSKAHCTIMTANLEDPTGYGRILRGKDRAVTGIREHGDASPEEKKISEINSGIYCFDVAELFSALKTVGTKNKQKEFYLTDVVEVFVKDGKKVVGETIQDPEEIMGINDRKQLSGAEKTMQKRINEEWMEKGVTLQFPESIFIDSKSKLGKDVTIEQGCIIRNSTIADGSHIESQCRLVDSKVGKNVKLKQGSYIEESEIGEESTVGPYAHLRPGSVLKESVKIGNFVEVKKSSFDKGSKASHLSYIGDAKIGKNVNIGCGFVTCNYDGYEKHETVIEDDVFIGSDSQTVAPVKIGKGSYIASGSTVTQNVPKDSLVISRGKQVTKEGYAKKLKKLKS